MPSEATWLTFSPCFFSVGGRFLLLLLLHEWCLKVLSSPELTWKVLQVACQKWPHKKPLRRIAFTSVLGRNSLSLMTTENSSHYSWVDFITAKVKLFSGVFLRISSLRWNTQRVRLLHVCLQRQLPAFLLCIMEMMRKKSHWLLVSWVIAQVVSQGGRWTMQWGSRGSCVRKQMPAFCPFW